METGSAQIVSAAFTDQAEGLRLTSTADPVHFSPAEESILRVLLYFDIFSHPLTTEEIRQFSSERGLRDADIAKACTEGGLAHFVRVDRGYHFLSDAGPDLVSQRLAKARRARSLLRMARLMALVIQTCPFVRAVFLSGELSKGVASAGTDIDYVIVTAEHRLWIVRTLLIVFKKLVLLNSKKYFCINHIVTEDHLTVEDRNWYVACELLTLRPLTGHSQLDRILGANSWLRDAFPNASLPSIDTDARGLSSRSVGRDRTGWLARLDHRLLVFWQRVWTRRYRSFSEEAVRRQFRTTPHLSTAYGSNFFDAIRLAYLERLGRFNLTDRFDMA